MKIKRKISDHFRENCNKLFLEETAEEDDSMTLENGNCDEAKWHFSQVKGTFDDDETDADLISCVEFNSTGDLLATGDKSGRIVIFQKKLKPLTTRESLGTVGCSALAKKKYDYRVYSTFQSHEAEFDYLKSLEIEEKINRIRWLKRRNFSHFLLSTNDKTIKLWKISERDKQMDGSSLIGSGGGRVTSTPPLHSFNGNGTIATTTTVDSSDFHDPDNDRMEVDHPVHVPSEYNLNAHQLKVPSIKPMDLVIEASPRRIFSNAHTYHINSISVNSDQETYLSADDLRINLWHLDITDQSFNIVDIKPKNMEELTEVITVAEFHPTQCNLFVYSSSKGTIRLCDMRAAALCDRHAKLFEEPDDDSQRCYFSEIISSISDVKFSHSGRYMISRDYLTVKVWDLHMESRPIETYKVHEFLYPNLCALYENDCIFDKFECCWSPNDNEILTGSYNNFFRLFDRNRKRDLTLEASKNTTKENVALKPRKVCLAGKRKKDEISVDCFDFTKKILHSTWHPTENIVAIAATNNLFIFEER